MYVHSPGNSRNLRDESLGNLIIGLRVPPNHLQIDRRRQAEVQNLRGDIGWLEEERRVRNLLAQAFAELYFVIASRAVFFLLQGNQNLAIRAGDGWNVSLGKARPTVRNPDVIDQFVNLIRRDDVADFALDGGEPQLGLFD